MTYIYRSILLNEYVMCFKINLGLFTFFSHFNLFSSLFPSVIMFWNRTSDDLFKRIHLTDMCNVLSMWLEWVEKQNNNKICYTQLNALHVLHETSTGISSFGKFVGTNKTTIPIGKHLFVTIAIVVAAATIEPNGSIGIVFILCFYMNRHGWMVWW